jgi:hypothetical protein
MLGFRLPRGWLHALVLVAAATVVSPGASAQSGDTLTALNQQVAVLIKARKYAEASPGR